jgi:hypothetical protein
VLAGAVLVGGLAAVILAVAFFEPHKLFIDERVEEALPSTTGSAVDKGEPAAESEQAAEAPPEQAVPPAPSLVVTGEFRNLEHATTGKASVLELRDGSRVLRLENFRTSNGPDLRVYLSAGSNDAFFGREYGENFVELGELKGNIGDQNYAIPSGVELQTYRNAVIWCKRFSVGFGVATLQ